MKFVTNLVKKLNSGELFYQSNRAVFLLAKNYYSNPGAGICRTKFGRKMNGRFPAPRPGFYIKIVILVIFVLLFNAKAKAVSLFDETVYRPLIADRKAYLPGNLLTVIVMETSDAQSSADLASGKVIKAALEASYNKTNHKLGLELNGKGKSSAKTGRNGKIKAALTVRIKSLEEGGSYFVEGQQQIRINGEQQTILLNGLVRPEDISAENTVLSTRIANAQITYSGDGSVSNAERHNYIYQVLSLIGLI
ncbi:MAG: flagellar basal body L-ring protein FlgH [Tatlockia sp.]|nr:flagellar basal body L-ring protein FlgH [Tatlockia sp.]